MSVCVSEIHLHLGELEEGVEVDVAVEHVHLPAVWIPI